MTRLVFRALVVGAALVAVTVGSPSAQSGHDLLQQALVKERAEGKLNEAVQLYLTVVKNAGRDRALAARALLQLAGCYEKLGNPEAARHTYGRVRVEFADQTAQATAATDRLARLASRETGGQRGDLRAQPRDTAPRRTDLPPGGGPSPDGRYFAFWSDNDLAVRDLATGDIRKLTAATEGQYIVSWEWSRDSRRLLFTWLEVSADGKSNTTQLRVIGVDGNGARAIGAKVEGLGLLGWSPDGRTALVSIRKESGDVRQLLSLDDGSVREVRMRGGRFDAMGFSPDGQHFVYTPDFTATPRAIFIVGIDGTEERPLIQDSSENRFVGWTPEGRGLLFTSDRSGTWDLWLVHVSNGRLEDLPVNLKRDVGPLSPRGLTADGTLYYAGAGAEAVSDVYTVSLDPKTGRVISPPAAVRQTSGHSSFPVWSSDGRQLAFKSGPSGPIWPTISILSMEGGQARNLGAPFKLGPRFDWSRDGRFFLQGGSQTGTRAGPWSLYRVDAQTGEWSSILQYGSGENLSLPRWLADGKSISYVKRANAVVVRDLETDAERTLVNPGSFIGSYKLSPDGGSLAFLTARDPDGSKGDIHVMTLADGRTRTLVEYQNHPIVPGQCCDALTWSPDSRYIVYADRTADAFVTGTTKKRAELWRIPAAGGPPEKLGLTLDSIAAPAVSPDGRRLAFVQSVDRSGLWVLQDFLPAPELRRGTGPKGGR